MAVSDTAATMALPRGTLRRTGDAGRDRAALVDLAREVGAAVVVVGLPLSLDGRRGPAARAVEEEAELLADALSAQGITLELVDERLTTVTAERELAAAAVPRQRRRSVVDAGAAAVVLRAWLARPGAR